MLGTQKKTRSDAPSGLVVRSAFFSAGRMWARVRKSAPSVIQHGYRTSGLVFHPAAAMPDLARDGGYQTQVIAATAKRSGRKAITSHSTRMRI